MSNLMQFINKSKTIDAKCEEYTKSIMQDYQNGVIKTETELLYRLKQAITEFYQSIGKPSFRFKPAVSTPISKDYNEMVQQANDDMNFIISDCINLTDAIKTSFMDNTLNKKMMFNEIRYIDKKLDEIKERISVNDKDGVVIYTESFTNTNTMGNMYNENAASINTTDGVLTLGTTLEKEYSSGALVELLDGSNGFPGNTHVVNILNNDIHFVGENNPHMNLNAIIDKNNDTIFEYELFNIDDETMDKCKGYGFNYKEGINWVTDDDSLILKLKITLPNRPVCNWLSLTPYFSEQKCVKPCFITKCIISNGESEVQEIKLNKVFDDDTAIVFRPQAVKYVTVEFSQRSFYEVNIGHFYFNKTNALNSTVFDTAMSEGVYNRVDGPMPSVELLGMKYDPKTKQCTQPKNYTYGNETGFINDAETRQSLFSIPADSEKVKAGIEMIKAYRYAIGIRNISVSNYDFDTNSEYISTLFTTDEPITSITLEADESIPIEWNQVIEKSNPELIDSWIKYSIKIGDDGKWYPIYPRHRAFNGYCTYKINNGDIDKFINATNKKNGVKTVNVFKDATTVQLKIEMSKPETDTYRTPILYQYKLRLLTGGENIEY